MKKSNKPRRSSTKPGPKLVRFVLVLRSTDGGIHQKKDGPFPEPVYCVFEVSDTVVGGFDGLIFSLDRSGNVQIESATSRVSHVLTLNGCKRPLQLRRIKNPRTERPIETRYCFCAFETQEQAERLMQAAEKKLRFLDKPGF